MTKISQRPSCRPWRPLFLLLAVCLWTATDAGDARAADEMVADQLAKAINHYASLEYDEGLALAKAQLQRNDLDAADRASVYAVLSMISYAKGKKYYDEAYQYLDKIMEVGPCVTPLPFEYWNNQLRERWYGMLQRTNQLVCENEGDPKIQTIAIMEFDNFSTGKYQEELGFLTKGLGDFFEADFAALNGLKVVERDKIDFILKEISMAQNGLVDEATAVRAGKLLGAQIMVFGSVMQMDGKNARMLVKAVKVETSEIIATAERTGKPEYFTMERELVKELAAKLDLQLNPEGAEALKADYTADNAAAALYSRGLYYVDKYKYAEAYDYFKQAYDADANFAEAKKKMDIYRPLAMSS